jgi:Dolichyl-phosphate-mannose-protein mannosyltransferase
VRVLGLKMDDSSTGIAPADPHPSPLPEHRETGKSRELGPYWRGVGICLAILAIYIAAIFFLHTETAMRTTAPPWYSWLRRPPRPSVYLLFPFIVFAGWMKFVRHILDRQINTGVLLAVAVTATFAMNVTTALMDGSPQAIWKPFDRPGAEYFADVASIHNVGSFLRGFVGNPGLSIHSRTHPPGGALLLYFISRLFGPSIRTAAWSAVVITATGVIPFFFLARSLVSNRAAKIAVAMYVLTPSLVIFGATSMDGVFLASLLWSMYFIQRVVAKPGILNSLLAGLSLSISFFFTYATICIVTLMAIYAVFESPHSAAKWRCLAVCAITTVLLFACVDSTTGFNYLACLGASRRYDHYLMGTSSMSLGRYLDISLSNLFAFLIGVGFPIIVLWWNQSIRGPRASHAFNLAGITCVVLFSFAHLFTHETERIWMFLIPVALLSAALWIDRQRGRLLQWTMALLFIQTWLIQMFLYTMW